MFNSVPGISRLQLQQPKTWLKYCKMALICATLYFLLIDFIYQLINLLKILELNAPRFFVLSISIKIKSRQYESEIFVNIE